MEKFCGKVIVKFFFFFFQVWCVVIFFDNEIVVFGGKDVFICLWRMKNGSEICVFFIVVDVFYVMMSYDKGIIVVFGDKFGV